MCNYGMGSLSLLKNIFEYFVDVDNIAKKIEEIEDANIDCVGLDLQFYFRERNEDTTKILKEIKQSRIPDSMSLPITYFQWLVYDFKKIVDDSESNCNQWESYVPLLRQRRVELDSLLKKEEDQTKIGNILS